MFVDFFEKKSTDGEVAISSDRLFLIFVTLLQKEYFLRSYIMTATINYL